MILKPKYQQFLSYSYSRKIIWLELLNSNNDPGVIVLPYLIAVLRNEGIMLVHVLRCHA